MSVFNKVMAGAGIGGALGYMGNPQDRGMGILGGAAGGALAGAFGPWAGGKLMGNQGLIGQGLRGARGLGATGSAWAGGSLQKLAGGSFLGKAGKASPYLRSGAFALGRGLESNRWGSQAVLGLGMASAASIGSSVLASNRGY